MLFVYFKILLKNFWFFSKYSENRIIYKPISKILDLRNNLKSIEIKESYY